VHSLRYYNPLIDIYGAIMRTHLIIPDTQSKPGVPSDHLTWIGRYIVDQRPDVIVHLGDHADFPSLSVYDRGKSSFHSRRYHDDLACAKRDFRMLNQPLVDHNIQKRKNKDRQYNPERHITLGNHEHRLSKAIEADAVQLEGLVSLRDLCYEDFGWTVHPFLKPVIIDGVHYAHYFYQPNTGRPYGGANLELRLKNIGHSFTMGHQQGKLIAARHLSDGTTQRGLVVGSCYLHDEDYKGPQANHHWRGIVVKHEVRNGNYDLMEVSLDYLCRRYEQMSLKTYLREKYPEMELTLKDV
jgi:hypothetical protein